MIIYMAGGVSGNLKPAWKAMKENTPEAFVEALKNENFWQGGESRHWIQYATSPIKENEDISSREHIVPEVYRSDAIRGGFSLNDGISCGRDPVWAEEKYRGGL